MQCLSPGLIVVIVSIPILTSCEDAPPDHSKSDLPDGRIHSGSAPGAIDSDASTGTQDGSA